jgi:protein involved in polysaccharide export with SLBB domain
MHRKNLFNYLFLSMLIFFAVSIGSGVSAQLSQTDFSKIKVDDLSDQQVQQFVERAKGTGMSMQQLEAEALRRGMPYNEIVKLRKRIDELGQEKEKRTTTETAPQGRRTSEESAELSLRMIPEEEPKEREEKKDSVQLKVFGSELFREQKLSFEPSLNIPTPRNYILGPGDELLIEVWGASQQSYQLMVSPEGFVTISNVGPVIVSGLTIEKATDLIIQRLSTIYSGLRGSNANTFAQVTMGNVRSIKVSIAGDARMPGTYTLPAFASAFNALYMAGGPSESGSLRDIRIIRDNKVIARIDMYDFLIRGETTSNIRLKDEDLVFIGSMRNRITIDGEVIRPAIYEMKENETLADLIDFSGGFSPEAYSARLQVDRKDGNKRQLLNVENALYSSFMLKPGDEIMVGKVLHLYVNRVSIRGAVYREGDFALMEGMTVSQLIHQAEGLREDAFTSRAALYRQSENLELKVTDLNLSEILSGAAPDVRLQKEDLLLISSVLELQQERTVSIMGEVQKPDSHPWMQNITLGEVIRRSGGLTDAASLARVEVARRISNRGSVSPGTSITEVFTFPLDAGLALSDQAASFVLQPFDMIFVRRSPGYQTQQLVQVEGEVVFPGSYAITAKSERISDLIKRTGGLTNQAYLPGATLIRQQTSSQLNKLRHLETSNTGGFDMIAKQNDSITHSIGIDLRGILETPYSRADLILMDGDILRIPQELQTVKLTGAVLHPTSARFRPNLGVRSYISQSGGFADNARKGKVYVIYPNGSVDRTRSILYIRNYPSVEPGSEIIVPMKPEREGRSLQETIAISSAITSMALIIVTILNQVKP